MGMNSVRAGETAYVHFRLSRIRTICNFPRLTPFGLGINEESKVKFYETGHETFTKANAKAFFETFLDNAAHIPRWLPLAGLSFCGWAAGNCRREAIPLRAV